MIPVCEPTLGAKEIEYATEAIKSGWISSAGKYIKEFENKFSAYCGVSQGVAASNGTTALHLALEVMGIGPGDEVIIPTFTMVASCNAVIYTGARPVLVDSEMKTWNMDVSKIEEKITPRTKAIMAVHIYGHPVDMEPLVQVARKHGLHIIEDAAEAHGAEYKGRRTGGLGDIAAFSFYSNKLITTGEGGMVVTNNTAWAENARALRNHYFGEPRFLHHGVGYNYRMTNVQAAIGLAQLERIGELVAMRRRNAVLYNSLLKNVNGIRTPPEEPWAKNVYWMYGVLVGDEFGMTMPQLREKLQQKGIETRTFFIGMHKQPVYRAGGDKRFPDCTGSYPVSDELEKRGFYLPSSSHLTKEQITEVAEAIKSLQEERK